MNTFKSLIISGIGLLGLASACAVDADSYAEDVAFNEDAVCSNEQGTNAAMATLGVATAMELRRWKPSTDFYVNTSTWAWKLALTSTGKSRCWDGFCKNVQAILDWQNSQYNGKIKFAGGEVLDPGVFASRLIARFDQQKVCESRPSNQPGNCAVEQHDLKFVKSQYGSCDTDYFFKAYKAGTTTPLQYPGNLKYQLLWVGWDPSGGNNSNPYLAFDVVGDNVRIDPVGGGLIGDPGASGSCPVVCTKMSATNITGQCCVCNGFQGQLKHPVPPPPNGSGNPYTFTCQ